MQERRNSSVNALELRLSSSNPSKWIHKKLFISSKLRKTMSMGYTIVCSCGKGTFPCSTLWSMSPCCSLLGISFYLSSQATATLYTPTLTCLVLTWDPIYIYIYISIIWVIMGQQGYSQNSDLLVALVWKDLTGYQVLTADMDSGWRALFFANLYVKFPQLWHM